jgi:hypothetical protein
MPNMDLTGRAVTKAAEKIFAIRSRLEDAIPLGPTQVEVTPAELKKNYATMTPQERQNFAISQGGIEEAMEMMNGNS